jgi:putative radical SAM enzyme (TIGR03279 family)
LLEIVAITPGSVAERLGVVKGDHVLSVNGRKVRDVIDYRFLVAEERVSIRLRTRGGRMRSLLLDKEPDDTLGMQFAPFALKRCRNRCIFCFVDQMPEGCRKSLYVKDDDFRASFLYGNYITLGALSEQDWRRIFAQRLSPLYLSVHTTDPALRSFIVGNSKAPDIMEGMKRLAAGGIRMHAQIVTCPGVNDGVFLERTLDDLSGLFPAVASIAVVPVGLTGCRKGLFPLRTFTPREARAVIDAVAGFGAEGKRRHGTRIAFASDEFYVKAGLPVPRPSFYEEFPQIENGVGMVADFLGNAAKTRLPARIRPLRATLVTGVSFSKTLKTATEPLDRIGGLAFKQVTVRNRFFGPSVTVAGLLTGSDIASALTGKRLGDLVVIPADALKDGEARFLDGMSLEDLELRLGVRVLPAGSFRDLIGLIKKEGGRVRL